MFASQLIRTEFRSFLARHVFFTILGVGILSSFLALRARAVATLIIDGQGFENPPYTQTFDFDGKLEGQLASLPSIPSKARWLASENTNSTAVLQSGVVKSGTQAVEVNHSVGDDPSFWGVPISGWPSERYVGIEWDMRIEGPSGAVGTEFGPYFGIDAIDDAGVGAEEGLIGSMGVLATSGEVVYTEASTLHLASTGTTVNFGEWNHFHLDLDFQEHEYIVILNGVELHTEPFVEGEFLDQFSDSPISTFDPFSEGVAGTAYFDNYFVYQTDAKEPFPNADFDEDIDVDGSDFLAFQQGNGITTGATHGDGDADVNGAVNGMDLIFWENQYGFPPPPLPAAPLTNVPEPSCLSLALMALILVPQFTTRKR